MATTFDSVPHTGPRDVGGTTSGGPSSSRPLLVCGVLYGVTYAIAADVVAATVYDGYSRLDQAISELSATSAPTRWFLPQCSPSTPR